MKAWLLVLAIVALILPASTFASNGYHVSTIAVAHPVILPTQVETITVSARDLDGRPLVGARASATLRYNRGSGHWVLPRTSKTGVTILKFKPPKGVTNANVTVSVSVTNGYISIPLTTHFQVRPALPAASPTATLTATPSRTPVKGSTPRPSPTATSVHLSATASAAATATPVNTVLVVARAVPAPLTVPATLWIVAYVHTATGIDIGGATVRAAVDFQEGTESGSGLTDAGGAAEIPLDTSSVRSSQTASVLVTVNAGAGDASTTTQVSLTVPPATPTPTPSPIPTSTPVLPTATPTMTATPVATLTGSAPSPTLLPTSTPIPTSTPTPSATLTPSASPTATVDPNCPGSMQGCMAAMLDMLNSTRAQYSLPALNLSQTQSLGTSNCVGALGHSIHMALEGYISHDEFPQDICVFGSHYAENVGVSGTGNELTDLQTMNTEMMSEPHDAVTCASGVNHACNILNKYFTQVGIGIDVAGGKTWLTEDFTG